ncbi:MAG: hypothetical protein NDP13_00485 [Crenarchaeota archaeon]|nr:hypothetical protein [Thermoproteota archaeon]
MNFKMATYSQSIPKIDQMVPGALIDVINPKDLESLKQMVLLGKHMGLKYLLVETSNLDVDISEIQIENSPKLIPIITIDSRSKSTLSEAFGRKIIFLQARSNREFIEGLKIPQVSVISVRLETLPELINPRTLHIFSQYYKFIELQFRDFIVADSRTRAGYVKLIRRNNELLNSKRLRLLVGSRASSIYEMISPRFLRDCLELLGFRDYILKKIFKETPKELILTPLEVVVSREGGHSGNRLNI